MNTPIGRMDAATRLKTALVQAGGAARAKRRIADGLCAGAPIVRV